MKNSYIDYDDRPYTWKGFTFKCEKNERPAIVYYFEGGVEQGFMRINSNKINTSTKGRKWGREMLNKLNGRGF